MDGVRVRHALRCALGGAVIAMLSVTGVTTGCITSVMYYVSVIAGTPGYHYGFIVRSTILTLYGSLIAVAIFLLIRLSFASSVAATFFAELPFIFFFAALRTERSLVPLPLVVVVFSGFFLISNIDSTRDEALRTARTLVLDSLLAAATALATQSILPDSAHACATSTIAKQMDETGAALSAAASRIFSVVYDTCEDCGTPDEHSADRPFGITENADWECIIPPGRHRVESYTALARASQMLDAAAYEPAHLSLRLLGRAEKDGEVWGKLLEEIEGLVAKVASGESAANVVGIRGEGRPHFSRKNLVMMLGEDNLELWVQHYAEAAAACHSVSRTIALLSDSRFSEATNFDGCLDARSELWFSRRRQMYESFKCQYVQYWKRRGHVYNCGTSKDTLRHADSKVEENGKTMLASLESLENEVEDGVVFEYEVEGEDLRRRKKANVVRGSEIRSIIFVAVSSHTLSESLARVQKVVYNACELRWRPQVLFRMAWLPVKPFMASTASVFRLQLEVWQVRFCITHSIMLGAIFAVSVFVDTVKTFETGQIAWVYASAGLAAQLSAESTLFIGILRAAATVIGCATAFGISRAVLVTGHKAAMLALGPYFFVITTTVMLVIPPKFRYASFLFILTNAIVAFCPRGSAACIAATSDFDSNCFPGWGFAVVRAGNVGIGVLIAVVVHALLWPRSAQSSARRGLAVTFYNAAQIFAAIHRRYRDVPTTEKNPLSDEDPAAPIDESLSTDSDPPTYTPAHMSQRAFEERILIEALYSDDGLGKVTELSLLTKCHVWKPLSSALLLLSSDASLWSKTKLAVPYVLKELPQHFVSLAVSLSELGSMLGRRPVLSGEYRGTAHDLFVLPLFYEHETLMVSLFHVANVVQKLLVAEKDQRALASLQCAIRHLKMTLRVMHGRIGEVRRVIHGSVDDETSSKHVAMKGDFRRVLSTGILADAAAAEVPKQYHGRELSNVLHVDDMVLYNAFSFASNGCMAAFLSIADVCEDHVHCLLGTEHGPTDDSKEK